MKKKNTRKVGVAFAAILLAVLMLAVCAVSFFVTQNAEKTSALDAASAKSVKEVTAFSDNNVRESAIFADNIFKRVTAASIAYTGEGSDLEKIASALSFDTLLITDDKGKITASYPEGEAGKSLKDDDNTKLLNVVAKGIAVKKLGDVQKTENGYSVYAAAARQDSAGAVVAKTQADEYADVNGDNLAQQCGEYVIIEKDGEVVSSTLKEDDKKSIKDFGGKDNGEPFEIKLKDGKKLDAKVEKAGDYTVMTAIEKGEPDNGNPNAFMIIGFTALGLTAAGCVLLVLVGKKEEE